MSTRLRYAKRRRLWRQLELGLTALLSALVLFANAITFTPPRVDALSVPRLGGFFRDDRVIEAAVATFDPAVQGAGFDLQPLGDDAAIAGELRKLDIVIRDAPSRLLVPGSAPEEHG